MKRCPKCKQTKPLSEYHRNKSRSDGLAAQCKPCTLEYLREYHLTTKGKASRLRSRRKDQQKHKMKHKYGITPEIYKGMLEDQNGACGICGGNNKGRRLCVDHCHKTEKVRGLLCNTCNSGIGYLKDNIDIMASAISYLQQN